MPLRAMKPEHPGTRSTAPLDRPSAGDNRRNGSAANDPLLAKMAASHKPRKDEVMIATGRIPVKRCRVGQIASLPAVVSRWLALDRVRPRHPQSPETVFQQYLPIDFAGAGLRQLGQIDHRSRVLIGKKVPFHIVLERACGLFAAK